MALTFWYPALTTIAMWIAIAVISTFSAYGGDAAPSHGNSGFAAHANEPSTTNGAKRADGKEPAPVLIREGTQVEDLIGRFKISGDQAVFVASSNHQQFGVLENLNLVRIMTAAADKDESEWAISGMVTEFRGSNFLLVSRAILKAKETALPRVDSPTRNEVNAPAVEGEKVH